VSLHPLEQTKTLIRSVSGNRVPREHAREEILVEDGKKEPFLYNPRPKAAVAGKVSDYDLVRAQLIE
jgi:hypothetical protein